VVASVGGQCVRVDVRAPLQRAARAAVTRDGRPHLVVLSVRGVVSPCETKLLFGRFGLKIERRAFFFSRPSFRQNEARPAEKKIYTVERRDPLENLNLK
jgi:hypothetical protein